MLWIVKSFRVKRVYLLGTAVMMLLVLPATVFLVDRVLWRQSQAVLAQPLAAKIIVIDPGHGGFDPGGIDKNGVLEKEINLELGKRLVEELRQAGAVVLLTREDDSDLSGSTTSDLLEKKQEDLQNRAALANSEQADLFISIHTHSHSEVALQGAQTFVQPGFPESKKLGQAIQAELSSVLKNTELYTQEADYYINRRLEIPAVLLETGFVSSADEEPLLQDPAYQSKISRAVYMGIARYFSEAGADDFVDPAAGKKAVIKVFKEQQPEPPGAP